MIRKEKSLTSQIKKRVSAVVPKSEMKYAGTTETMISTGSTLLDLAISGGRIRGGGLPAGILVEIFGPSGSGKTVLLSEIAGAIQRQQGRIMFHDPESRLNKQFAQLFGFDLEKESYSRPDTVPEVFKAIREWEPEIKNKTAINAIFADSLAALSTNLEMTNDDGDKMGMRRAKEFSEELRKTARILTQKNYLLVCSNQVRVNVDAGPYGQKYVSPGGESIGFYSSLRLRVSSPSKIKEKKKVAGKEISRVVGIEVIVEVYKSSIWKPYRTAPLTIKFDYGIDDIRENLQFIKDYSKNTTYTVGGESFGVSKDDAVKAVEEQGLEKVLREEVIDLWEDIESRFETPRKSKER